MPTSLKRYQEAEQFNPIPFTSHNRQPFLRTPESKDPAQQYLCNALNRRVAAGPDTKLCASFS